MTVATSASALPSRRAYHDHIIDELIAERAPRLTSQPAWPLVRPLVYAALHYAKARRMADAIGPLPGRAGLDHVSRRLDLRVTARGLAHVPRQGRAVIVCNHPTGIADGIAVFDALKDLRPDLCFYANSDAHRVSPGLADMLIPVEWVEAKRTRQRTRVTLALTREAMEAGRPLVIFPAGRLARRTPAGDLRDPPWAPSALSLARRYAAPIVPVHLAGPWSTLFHLFDRFSGELRDITLFHELLNKRGGAFTLTVGAPIDPQRLDPDAATATLALKAYVEEVLPVDPDRAFPC